MIKDPLHEKKPALRISHIVYGRETRGNRVVYLVDPKGGGTEKQISESVVLFRWRRRIFPGHTFSGAKLHPKIWRILPTIFGPDTGAWTTLSENNIAELILRKRSEPQDEYFSLPGANVLKALFEVSGAARLATIIARHNAPERASNYGTPDLFLYAIDTATKAPVIARFVEVKKPEEPLSQDQREEIKFLQSLGLHARVLRLIEKN